MDPAPWRTDRPLDAKLVTALVAEQFPDLAPVRAHLFGEGWDSEVYLVNNRLLFTFPKREETLDAFRRGLELLPILAAALPVPVPEIRYRGRATDDFPYPFAGYPLILGIPAIESTPPRSAWPGLAATLGAALTRLHSLDPGELPAGLPDHGDALAPEPLPQRVVRALRRELHGEPIEPFLTGETEPPPAYTGPRVVTHADLFDYHVILTPDERGVAGIIDWFDLGTCDPMTDFVGFQLWLGPEFAEMVLSEYGGTVDDGFSDRLRFRAKIVALQEYGTSLDPDSPGDAALGRRYVSNAFGARSRK